MEGREGPAEAPVGPEDIAEGRVAPAEAPAASVARGEARAGRALAAHAADHPVPRWAVCGADGPRPHPPWAAAGIARHGTAVVAAVCCPCWCWPVWRCWA